MESIVIASKAPVQVCADGQDDTRQYLMDVTFDKSTFHCKFRMSARVVNPVKKTFIYVFLDASHVQSLEVCDEDIPSEVTSAFVKQAHCSSSSDVVAIRFVLKNHAPLVTPDLLLQKRPSTRKEIGAFLKLGQCESFKVYVPSGAIKRERFLGLCTALARGSLMPAPEGIIRTLYADSDSKIVTHVDELWTLDQSENPPPYEASAGPGASNHESAGHPRTRPSSESRARGKRRISPEPRQTPTKRHALAEKAALEQPWEVAVAAQSIQLAALNAQLIALRDEMQQLRRPLMVDAESQTDPVVEFERQSSPVSPVSRRHLSPALCLPSASQASTIENSVEDRLIMLEDGLIDEQRVRRMLDEKIDSNDERVRQKLDVECNGLEHAVTEIESRVNDIENDFRDDLRKELSLELQTKLEEFIEFRLEDVEEVVKHDVRMAMENASYKFKMELGWVD